jgi:ankyrin repeat protein
MISSVLDKKLYEAVFNAQYERVECLLAAGASPDATDKVGLRGSSALIRAVNMNDPKMLGILLAAGANPNQTDDGDFAPLHHAIVHHCFDLADILLDYGADINVQAGNLHLRLNLAPLHTAVFCDNNNTDGSTERIDYLLRRGASGDVVDARGQTPAYHARACGGQKWQKVARRIENWKSGNARAMIDRGIEKETKAPSIKIRRKPGSMKP